MMNTIIGASQEPSTGVRVTEQPVEEAEEELVPEPNVLVVVDPRPEPGALLSRCV